MLSGYAQVLTKFFRWKRKFRTLWWDTLDQLLLILKTEEDPCYLSHHGGKLLHPEKKTIGRRGLLWLAFERGFPAQWHRHGRRGIIRYLNHTQEAENLVPEMGGVTRPMWETPIPSSSGWRWDGFWPWIDLIRVCAIWHWSGKDSSEQITDIPHLWVTNKLFL